MFTQLNQKAAFSPVSTAAMMEYLRATPEEEPLVKRLVRRAQDAFVKHTNGFTPTETMYTSWYDLSELQAMDHIPVPYRPLLFVSNVIAFNQENEPIVLENFSYTPGDSRIFLDAPIEETLRVKNTLSVTYTVGMNPAAIPDDILAGIEQYVVYLYENRGDTDMELPDSVKVLWAPYIIYRF